MSELLQTATVIPTDRRIRLLVVRTSLGQGGADRMTIALLRDLDRARFDTTLALMRRQGEFVADVPADVPIDDLGARSLWFMVAPLAAALRRHRPDVVFALDSGVSIPAILAHRLTRSRARLVLSERSILWNNGVSAKRAVQNGLKRLLYRHADLVTVVSDGVGEDLIARLRLDRARVRPVYNPVVDASIAALAAEPVSHPWFAADVPIVIAMGRMVPQKDYPTMFEAFARVRARRPARLFVLGDGPLRPSLERVVAELGLGADVCLAGFDKNPFRYLSRATVYVLSSRNEGLPGALIQAMACGLPPVSTDCPAGPNEIISRPGENGFLVPVGDAAAIADRVLALLADPALRAAIGARARAAVQRFRAEESLRSYVAALVGE